MERRAFLASVAGALGLASYVNAGDKTESAADLARLVKQLGSSYATEYTPARRALAKLGKAALPALETAAKHSPDAQVRQRAKSLLTTLAQWPCHSTADVKQSVRVLAGTEKEFHQAQAKLSWQGEQMKPIYTASFVTQGYTEAPYLFPERHNDVAGMFLFTVTPKEFQRMMAGVRKLVLAKANGDRYIRDYTRDVVLDVVRAHGSACEGHSFFVSMANRKAFYQALLDGLSPNNKEGRHRLTRQRVSVGADD